MNDLDGSNQPHEAVRGDIGRSSTSSETTEMSNLEDSIQHHEAVGVDTEGSNTPSQPAEMNNLEDSNQPHEDVRVDIGEPNYLSPDEISTLEREQPDNENKRAAYLGICVPLYRAAMIGDWNAAKIVIDDHRHIVRRPITSKRETALHIAAAAKHKGFVKNLLTKMNKNDLALKNKDQNTAICFAAASGVKEIAEMMVDMNKALPLIRGNGNMTPLHMAALFGHREMVLYLYDKTDLNSLKRKELVNLLHVIISADIYDVALKMLKNYQELATSRNGVGETALHLMARKPSAITREKELGCFKRLANSIFKGAFHNALMQTFAHRLVEELWKQVLKLPDQKVSELLRRPSRLLFDAAASGNVEFLVILIRSYPDLVWKVDDKNRSLFHVAALNRHECIFNLIFELGAIKDLIAAYKEENTRNNMLHLVACLPPPDRMQIISGAALQMQRELLWFKAVKEIVPRSYIKTENKETELPWDIFTKKHQGLRKEGEKWMRDTASSCMLVATLIATVVFAAAFTVPGGNDQTKGFPLLRRNDWFSAFILSDAVALFSSSTSIVIFLSILTSRYAEDDFQVSLPSRLMMGLLALFVSIIAMIVAFSASLLLIHDLKIPKMPTLIICLASVTALTFVLLHCQLWFDTLRSAYWSRFLFQKSKRRLFR